MMVNPQHDVCLKLDLVFYLIIKLYFVKFLFIGASALLLFYSAGIMASCNYIPQIMFNNVF